MQQYLTDLVSNMEQMKVDKDEIDKQIADDEKEKQNIEADLEALNARLQELNGEFKFIYQRVLQGKSKLRWIMIRV